MPDPTRPPAVVRYLRAAVGPDADGPADAELLRRFADTRDQGAFELLVWRHAGLVFGVCRGVLRDHHAAEDATQATFLALARKAGSVRGNAAGWLYKVAFRIALRARRAESVSGPGMELLPATGAPGSPDPDVIAAVHEEVANLSDKYRLPILLCFFEGLSHADAAKRLGWPVGTVAGRIARAKDALHARLTRRGVAVPAAGFAALAADGPGLGGAFAADTARAAAMFVGGAVVPGVSPTVFLMAKGAIRTMTVTKLQLAAGLVTAFGAITVGGAWAVGQGPGTGPPGGGIGAGPPAAAGGVAPPQPVERLKVDPNAPNPGKPADPNRAADYVLRRRSLETLKQIGIAIHSFHDSTGTMPADIHDKDGKPLLSWRVLLLPYLEQGVLYGRFKLDEPWDSEHNRKLLAEMPDVYRLGFQPKNATDTYYQAFAGPSTAFEPGKRLRIPASFPDGTSNTLAVAEVGPPVPWTKPADVPYHPGKPFPKVEWPFANVIHLVMMDGSANTVKPDIGEFWLRRLIDRDDGQPVPMIVEFKPVFPAESAEEKAELKRLMAENQGQLAIIDAQLKEQVKLWALYNSLNPSVDKAEELNRHLKRFSAEMLAPLNKKFRDELGLGRGAKIPDPSKKD